MSQTGMDSKWRIFALHQKHHDPSIGNFTISLIELNIKKVNNIWII